MAPSPRITPVDFGAHGGDSQDSSDGSSHLSPVQAMPLDAFLVAVQDPAESSVQDPTEAEVAKGGQQMFSTTSTDQLSSDPSSSGVGSEESKPKSKSFSHEHQSFQTFHPGHGFRDELVPPPWYTEWGWKQEFRRSYKAVPDWVWECRKDIISGLTVALAQVPEAVAFSFVAGVDPEVGLTAAWIMGVSTS